MHIYKDIAIPKSPYTHSLQHERETKSHKSIIIKLFQMFTLNKEPNPTFCYIIYFLSQVQIFGLLMVYSHENLQFE